MAIPPGVSDLVDPRASLTAGLAAERAGRIEVAFDHYAAALETSGDTEGATRSEGLRRLAVLHNLRGECEVAQDLGLQAYQVALRAEAKREAAEALNALAGFAFESGSMVQAGRFYEQARELAVDFHELLPRIDHNLGILANVRGDRAQAAAHFQAALVAAERIGDARQAGMAFHNLGMICVDMAEYAGAEAHFEQALLRALAIGDLHLEGLCHLNLAETHLRQGRSAIARGDAEEALTIFEGLDSRRDKGATNRVLGMIFRDSGRTALAESKLCSAIEIARSTTCPLSEAEARRELALLYQRIGRRAEAATQFEKAYTLFGNLEARIDQEDVRHLMGTVYEGVEGSADRRRRG